MSVMVKEIFEAFVEAGASQEKAAAAAGVAPVTEKTLRIRRLPVFK